MKLIEYIKGQRHGKDAHRIEKEAMRDPFLSDAIDGFDTIKGNHVEHIDEMRHRVSRQTRRVNHRLIYTGIAASFVILLTVGSYFLFKEKPDNFLARSESSLNKEQVNKPVREELPLFDNEGGIDEEVANNNLDLGVEDHIGKDDNSVSVEQKMAVNEDDEDAVEVVIPSATSASKKSSSRDISVDEKVQKEKLQAEVEEVKEQILIVDDSGEGVTVAQVAENEDKKTMQEQKKPVSAAPATTRAIMGQEKKTVARLETPEPKIGWKAYRKYLKNSLRRPSEGDCVKSKGTVEVTFHIDENGVPYDFVIGKSLCSDADAEAIRLVKEGCLWTNKSFKRMTVDVKF